MKEHLQETKEPSYIYVFVRQDIAVADQMVQVGHVCYESGLRFKADPHTYLVLCAVANEEELLAVEEHLGCHNIESHKFHEPDDNMGFTTLCSAPVSGEHRKLFRKYRLWKG